MEGKKKGRKEGYQGRMLRKDAREGRKVKEERTEDC